MAVVFDCDGLLMDTERCWTVAETELFARRGFGFGDDEKALLIGKSLDAAAVTLAEVFDETGREQELIDELLVLVAEAVGSGAQIMEGASDFVKRSAAVLPVAVASNSPRSLLDVALRRGGLQDAFEVSLAADEVVDAKPAPDIYLEACRRLHVAPHAALAFEDSSTGIRSATAAGLRSVGIPTLKGRTLDADWVFDSLTDPELLAWVDRW